MAVGAAGVALRPRSAGGAPRPRAAMPTEQRLGPVPSANGSLGEQSLARSSSRGSSRPRSAGPAGNQPTGLAPVGRTHPDAQEARARAEARRGAEDVMIAAERAGMALAFRRSATLGGEQWKNSFLTLELAYSGSGSIWALADPADGAAGSTISPLPGASLLPSTVRGSARKNASPTRAGRKASPTRVGDKAYQLGARGRPARDFQF
ncbi:hypothetical protein T492DRAFT_1061733 [Pavlovales sp. CCMP2436]|nr:hypothetical protein T492DRAFT_1061733 [Pavlovales sp. CCMP2436]